MIFDRRPLNPDELEQQTIPGDHQCIADLSHLIPALRKINLKSLLGNGELSAYRRVWGASSNEKDGENS